MKCVDWRLLRELGDHDTRTTRQMGWNTVKNGELLARASAVFDVFVTVDRNLAFQQNLTQHPIAVIVLVARSNRLADLRALIPDLLVAIDTAAPGPVTHVGLV